ncbi:MAG: hypothetical protein LBN11_06860 [Tannerella sp.]|nr:hypothetical protein [Tannerella sp.]
MKIKKNGHCGIVETWHAASPSAKGVIARDSYRTGSAIQFLTNEFFDILVYTLDSIVLNHDLNKIKKILKRKILEILKIL